MIPTDPKRARFPLSEQAKEASQELAQRYRIYAARVKAGTMSQSEADRGIALMRCMRDTLTLFAEYENEMRALLLHLKRRAREKEEIEDLRRNPAVRAVLEQFPDSDVGLPIADPPEQPPFDLPRREEAVT